MLKINLDNDVYQEFYISFEDDNIKVTLRQVLDFWSMDVEYQGTTLYGFKLASRVLILEGNNFPFDFVVDDKGLGLDPFNENSFSEGYFDLLLLEREDLETIRGYDVQ